MLPDTAPANTYTLSLHDALPISGTLIRERGVTWSSGTLHLFTSTDVSWREGIPREVLALGELFEVTGLRRSEEHTSELQSQSNLVCRLLRENKQSSVTSRCRT